jgi:hypothetical protein
MQRIVIVANGENVVFIPLEDKQLWKDGENIASYLRKVHSEELSNAIIRKAYAIDGDIVPLKIYSRKDVGFD